MAGHAITIDPDYFENMFRGTSDPWELETSAYEQAKFNASIAALDDRTYTKGFEVGCAKGVLTAKLSPLCAALLAIDVSETALNAARGRTADHVNVTYERMVFPTDAPSDQFDLVVWSEVAYYWDDADLARAADWLGNHLALDGDLLLVHFTGDTNYPQSGDDAVTKLSETLGHAVKVVRSERRDRYRLDLWRRT